MMLKTKRIWLGGSPWRVGRCYTAHLLRRLAAAIAHDGADQ